MAVLTDVELAATRSADPAARSAVVNVGLQMTRTADLLSTRAAAEAALRGSDNFTPDFAEARTVMGQPGAIGTAAAERAVRRSARTEVTLFQTMQDIAGRTPRGTSRAQDFTPEQRINRNRFGRGL